MAQFIQICASANDLFALEEHGDVYRYDFNVRTWMKLIAIRETREDPMRPAPGGLPTA